MHCGARGTPGDMDDSLVPKIDEMSQAKARTDKFVV